MADALRLVGAVQAEIGVVAIAVEIKRARAERIVRTVVHTASIGPIARHRCDHVRSGCPTRPLLSAPDHRAATEIQRLGAAYADRVAQRAPIALHQIEAPLGYDDHDAARTLIASPSNLLTQQARVDVGEINLRDCEATILHRAGAKAARTAATGHQ